MEKYVSLETIQGYRKQGNYDRWLELAGTSINEQSASYRLKKNEYVNVFSQPKFSLGKNDKVFTIGSCFARNIEEKLILNGIDVLTKSLKISPEYYAVPARPNAVLNKYNTHSIESEILSVLNSDANKEDYALVEIRDGIWWDPHASHTKPMDKETTMSIRNQINSVQKNIERCDVVIITLGLNEVWLDLDSRVYLNSAPPPQAFKRFPDRFVVTFPGVQENVDSLRRTIQAVRQHAEKCKFVITVSPVPMGTTFSGKDIIIANTYSKSVLIAAARLLVDEFDFVDYFPSYEIALNSPKDMVWMADMLHVKDEAVGYITSTFVNRYIENR